MTKKSKPQPKKPKQTSNSVWQPCEDCGSTENVEYGPDPYASEIHDDETPHYLCAVCLDALAAEV